MLKKIFLSLILFGCLSTKPVFAQNALDLVSIPVEIAMMYQKVQGQIPDFEKLALLTPNYQKAPDFAKTEVLYSQAKTLKNIFHDDARMNHIVVLDDLLIDTYNPQNYEFSFRDFDFDKYYLYIYGDETYILFIRNIDDYQIFKANNKSHGFISSAYIKNDYVAAELILKPVRADINPYIMDDKTPANLILADLEEIKLVTYESGQILYHDISQKLKAKTHLQKVSNDLFNN